jgi:hypothetical protein
MATPERIHEIIEFATTDAYNEDEQMGGWGVALDEVARFPFAAAALGKSVRVLAFDAVAGKGIRCEIEGAGIGRRWVGIDTLDAASLPEPVREVLDAYDAWSAGDY